MNRIAITTGRGGLHRRLIRVGAAAATAAVVAGLTLAAPLSASAQDRPESYAKGQFLSGTVLGTNLSKLALVNPAVSRNDGTQSTQTQSDPFSATALDTPVGSGGSQQLGLGDFLQVGAVHQYATAKNDGSSMAASGAIANNGAIQTNTNQSASSNATFDLSKLLGSQFASTLSDLKLELGAAAAQANGNLDTASGSYNLASAKLTFSSPAIAQLSQKVDSAIDSVDSDLGNLTGKNGDLVKKLTTLLPLSGTGLDLLGSNATVTASIDTGDLKAAVQSLLDSQFSADGVSVDLEHGTVTLDLAALAGGKLNNLAPGTELISDQVIDQVLDSITSKVSTIADQVVAKVKDALNNATVHITADASASVPQLPVLGPLVCHLVDIPGVTDGTGLGTLLGGVLGTVTTPLTQNVCSQTSTPVAPKLTDLSVNIDGSVKQIVAGNTGVAKVGLSVLGVPTNIDLPNVLGGLGSTLTDQLFGSSGTVAKLTTALQNGLVHPAVAGLVGPGTGPVALALTKLLSVKVNLQETTTGSSGGMAAATGKLFTETAARVTVLGGVGGSSLATINLAQATVGPNVTSVVPGCTVNCGGGCTVNCGGDPGCTLHCTGGPSTPTASRIDHLATTGLSIAALVAAMLALLAAGAYLVREGYKRRQLTPIG